MKLDRLKFAKLIGFLTYSVGSLSDSVVEDLDDMIDVNVDSAALKYVSTSIVDDLLREIANPDGFINAIKAYRVLTGAGLKEAKEAIERYRLIPKFADKEIANNDMLRRNQPVDPKDATLGDILETALQKQKHS